MTKDGGAGGPILVVVDFSPLLRLVTRYLTEAGYQVEATADGPDALARFRRIGASAVVTNNMMLDMDGAEVAAAVKALSPGTPVVLLTGTLESLPPCVDYLVRKPFTKEQLGETLRRALRGR